MIQILLVAVLYFIRNKQSSCNWDKLRPAWDWDKSADSISGVRLYHILLDTVKECEDFLYSATIPVTPDTVSQCDKDWYLSMYILHTDTSVHTHKFEPFHSYY